MTQKQRALLTQSEIADIVGGAKEWYELPQLVAQAQLDKAWELAEKEGKRELYSWGTSVCEEHSHLFQTERFQCYDCLQALKE